MKDKSFEDVEELTQIETKKRDIEDVEILDSEIETESEYEDTISHQESIDMSASAEEIDDLSDTPYTEPETEEVTDFEEDVVEPEFTESKTKGGPSPLIWVLVLALFGGGGYFIYENYLNKPNAVVSTELNEPQNQLEQNNDSNLSSISESSNANSTESESTATENSVSDTAIVDSNSSESVTGDIQSEAPTSDVPSISTVPPTEDKNEPILDESSNTENSKSYSDLTEAEQKDLNQNQTQTQTLTQESAENINQTDGATEPKSVIPNEEFSKLDPNLFGQNEFQNPDETDRKPDVVEVFEIPPDQYKSNQKDTDTETDSISESALESKLEGTDSSDTMLGVVPSNSGGSSNEPDIAVSENIQPRDPIKVEDPVSSHVMTGGEPEKQAQSEPGSQPESRTQPGPEFQNKPIDIVEPTGPAEPSELEVPVIVPVEQKPVQPSTPVQSVDTKGPTALPPELDPIYRQKVAQIKSRIDQVNNYLLVSKDRPKALSVIALLSSEDLDPKLQEAIDKDRKNIESVQGMDQARIASVTKDLQKLIYDLPFNSADKKSDLNSLETSKAMKAETVPSEPKAKVDEKPKGNWFARQWNSVKEIPSDIYNGVKEDIQSLVKVEKFDDISSATLSIEEVKTLKLSAINHLNFAQSALNSGDGEYWKSSLNEVKTIIQSNTNPESPKAAHVIAVLDKLMEEPIATKYPIMTETLRVYKELYPITSEIKPNN
ncbi:uroporphyrinogen-III C-methyltransferase [Taylorella asinigenitalis]|uniref:Uncharacterized protein n=1 Tax=Taylorella asinigenitalis (strain MCE3) TaxID=1008459 RepID=G4Q9I4_TAYAM|nr:uroporphyrinogen-III C-methyltransferase [Taylorella asinigenitalis]AEP36521.1 hypothetical protein TASI_0750 [Taylorella asinigenitalis MCE3]